MGIRIEHQPSGAAVGMAAFAAGQGKARDRQKRYAMGMWEAERRRQTRREEMGAGFRYRAMLEGARQQGAQNRFDIREEAMDRRFNAQQDATQGRFEAGQAANQQRGDQRFASDLYKQQKSQFDEILSAGGGVVPQTPEGKAFWNKVKKLQEDEQKAMASGNISDSERIGEMNSRMAAILGEYNPNKHIVPRNEREGNTFTDDSGAIFRRTPDGGQEFQGFAKEDPMSMDDIQQGKSKNWRLTPHGTLQQRKWGRHGEAWEDVNQPEAAPSYSDRLGDAVTQNKQAYNDALYRDGVVDEQTATPKQLDKARKEANRLAPIPTEETPGDSAGAPKVRFDPATGQTIAAKRPATAQPSVSQPLSAAPEQPPEAAPTEPVYSEPTPTKLQDGTKIPQMHEMGGVTDEELEETRKGAETTQAVEQEQSQKEELRQQKYKAAMSRRAAVQQERQQAVTERGQARAAARKSRLGKSQTFSFSGSDTSMKRQQRPLPSGMPPGAEWFDENTILLPDGRKIRRGGM